jgi:hypothetical protein
MVPVKHSAMTPTTVPTTRNQDDELVRVDCDDRCFIVLRLNPVDNRYQCVNVQNYDNDGLEGENTVRTKRTSAAIQTR